MNEQAYYKKKRPGWLKNLIFWRTKPVITAFRSYASNKHLVLSGSLSRSFRIKPAKPNNSMLRNMLSQIKRYLAKPMKNEKVRLQWGDYREIAVTNDNGIFRLIIELNEEGQQPFSIDWDEFYAEALLSDADETTEDSVSAKGEVMKIGELAKLAVISDIDDTVLLSHSTRVPAKLRLLLFKNSYTRKAFSGVSDLYRQISGKHSSVPFFYVSSSEWNLYKPLLEFFEVNELPKGVFLLRDLQYSIFKFWKAGGGSHQHKKDKIRSLMLSFPHLDVLLFGDSGQSDPQIYSDISDEFPERVKAVVIRRIEGDENAPVTNAAVPFYYVNESKEAAEILESEEII